MQVSKYAYIENERPALKGVLRGSAGYPEIAGEVYIYWLPEDIYLTAEFEGLPPSDVFGFHIHEGIICEPVSGDAPFTSAGEHYSNCGDNGIWCDRHPYHAGDLPPIISDAQGKASMQVHLDKATVAELSGRTIILHRRPDDFKTQPSGNSGIRIACGILTEVL